MTTALVVTNSERNPDWTSRPALEAQVVRLNDMIFWEKAERYATETRLEREMETSIRLGAEVVTLRRELRTCEERFQWADARVRRDR